MVTAKACHSWTRAPDFGIGAGIPGVAVDRVFGEALIGAPAATNPIPRQRPGSFAFDQAMEMLMRRTSN
jgi:hypothetical protein